MALRNAVQLICYPNRIGHNLGDLYRFMTTHLDGAVGGVHILPFFPSNADSGFSPLTFKAVDPGYGSWDDIERIAATYDLCADLTVNHLSDESEEFKDFLRHGYASPFAEMFFNADKWGGISSEDLARIHIRKEKEPFREVTFADGSKGRVWCTFTERQIDLDWESALTHEFMESAIRFLAGRGVKLFRLDAFGYITKRPGTSCFLVEPDIYRHLEWINEIAAMHGAECLPEVHDHSSYQHALSRRQMRPYGFALPPLVLHALLEHNSIYLKHWLRQCPRNMITVLDTHDGICIPDVQGLLPQEQIQHMLEQLETRSADPILRRRAVDAFSVGSIYQITCTFYEALQRDDDAYIAARAIQFFAPGIPQVYYVGLLAGRNDYALADASGDPRDVNRHHYRFEEACAALEQPVAQRQLRLMQFRSNFEAFQGRFELHYSGDSSIAMAWRHGHHFCLLHVDLATSVAVVRYTDDSGEHVFSC